MRPLFIPAPYYAYMPLFTAISFEKYSEYQILSSNLKREIPPAAQRLQTSRQIRAIRARGNWISLSIDRMTPSLALSGSGFRHFPPNDYQCTRYLARRVQAFSDLKNIWWLRINNIILCKYFDGLLYRSIRSSLLIILKRGIHSRINKFFYLLKYIFSYNKKYISKTYELLERYISLTFDFLTDRRRYDKKKPRNCSHTQFGTTLN